MKSIDETKFLNFVYFIISRIPFGLRRFLIGLENASHVSCPPKFQAQIFRMFCLRDQTSRGQPTRDTKQGSPASTQRANAGQITPEVNDEKASVEKTPLPNGTDTASPKRPRKVSVSSLKVMDGPDTTKTTLVSASSVSSAATHWRWLSKDIDETQRCRWLFRWCYAKTNMFGWLAVPTLKQYWTFYLFPQTITRGGLDTRKYYTNPARTYSRPQFTIWTLEVEIRKLSRVTKGTKRGGGNNYGKDLGVIIGIPSRSLRHVLTFVYRIQSGMKPSSLMSKPLTFDTLTCAYGANLKRKTRKISYLAMWVEMILHS